MIEEELVEFYAEELEASYVRLSGAGDKPAPFKRLSKNEYLPSARKYIPKRDNADGEVTMQCNCVNVSAVSTYILRLRKSDTNAFCEGFLSTYIGPKNHDCLFHVSTGTRCTCLSRSIVSQSRFVHRM